MNNVDKVTMTPELAKAIEREVKAEEPKAETISASLREALKKRDDEIADWKEDCNV